MLKHERFDGTFRLATRRVVFVLMSSSKCSYADIAEPLGESLTVIDKW